MTEIAELLKFDGTEWTVYYEQDSVLGYRSVNDIAVDRYNNKWFATDSGVVVYNEDGVVAVKDKKPLVKKSTNKISFNIKNFSIIYEVQAPGNIKLQLYNAKGRLLLTLVDSYKKAGEYKVNWDSKRFGAGIYFIKLSSNSSIVTKKVIVIK